MSVRNFVFEPAQLAIQVGDTVNWTNEGGAHNVEAPNFFRCANGCDGQGGNGDVASNPWSFSLTFDSEAEIEYYCQLHRLSGMKGSLTVVPQTDPTLNLVGECPGAVQFVFRGGSPGGRAAVGFAPSLGTDPISAGSCAGTPTGLSAPKLLTIISLDENGGATLDATLPDTGCALFLQAVDPATCATSNTSEIP